MLHKDQSQTHASGNNECKHKVMLKCNPWVRWHRKSQKARLNSNWEWAAVPQRAGELFTFPRVEPLLETQSVKRCTPSLQARFARSATSSWTWSMVTVPSTAASVTGPWRWLGTKMGARPMIVIESIRVFVSDAVVCACMGMYLLVFSSYQHHDVPVTSSQCMCHDVHVLADNIRQKCLSMKCRYVHVSASFC